MKTYKALAPFRSYAKGDEFKAKLDPFIEKWAKEQGLIEQVKQQDKGKEKADG